jgi:hypothetical protein
MINFKKIIGTQIARLEAEKNKKIVGHLQSLANSWFLVDVGFCEKNASLLTSFLDEKKEVTITKEDLDSLAVNVVSNSKEQITEIYSDPKIVEMENDISILHRVLEKIEDKNYLSAEEFQGVENILSAFSGKIQQQGCLNKLRSLVREANSISPETPISPGRSRNSLLAVGSSAGASSSSSSIPTTETSLSS